MNKVAKTAIKISVSALILLTLIIGAGIGYVWYTGQNNQDELAKQTVEAVKPEAVIAPVKQADDANVGASVQSLTTPVVPGTNSSITVKTNPEAKCTISVTYNKIPSKDSGLIPKVADEYGVVDWSWTVESTVPIGKWPVKVTCTKGKKSGVTAGDLVVVSKLEE